MARRTNTEYAVSFLLF